MFRPGILTFINSNQAATLILQKYPEKILPLIQRWVDFEGRYGEVL